MDPEELTPPPPRTTPEVDVVADGKVTRVPADAATQGFAQGRYALPSTSSKVWMTDPDGVTGQVDAAKAGEAIRTAGYRFSTREEQAAADAKNHKTEAFIEGLGRTVTGGLTDVAAQQIASKYGDGHSLDEYRARAETGAATAGELAGFGAGVLGGDAAAVVTKSLSGLVERSAALQAAKTATSDAASSALTKIMGERAAQAAVHAGLNSVPRAATENFVYGVGSELSEQALGENPDYNVQALWTAGLGGALIGAGLDSALHVPGLVKTARREAASDAARISNAAERAKRGTPVITDPLEAKVNESGNVVLDDQDLAAYFNRTSGDEALSKQGESFLGSLVRKAEEKFIDPVAAAGSGMTAEELRALRTPKNLKFIREGQVGVERVGKQLKEALEDMSRMGEADSKLAFQQLRPALRDEVLAQAGSPEAVQSMAGALNSLRNQIAEFKLNPAGMTAERAAGVVKPFEDEIARIERGMWKEAGVKPRVRAAEVGAGKVKRNLFSLDELADRVDADHVAAVRAGYDRIDRLKNFLGKPAKFGEEFGAAADVEIQKRFQEMFHGIKGHLEDESVWGRAGSMQAQLNEAAAARIRALEGLEAVFGLKKGVVDSGKVMSHLSALKSMRGDKGVEALDAFLAAQNKFAEVVDGHFDGVGMSGQTKALTDRMMAIREELANRVRVFNIVRERVNAENQMLGGGMMFGGGLAGLAYGGLPGAAMGAAVGGWLRPGRQLMVRAHMGAMMDGIKAMVRDKVASAVGVRDAAASAVARVTPSKSTVERTLARATIKMLSDDPKERREGFEERMAQLDRLADPATSTADQAVQMRALQRQAPMHATIASMKAAEAVQTLKQYLPAVNPGRAAFDPLEPHTALKGPSVTDRDIERFARIDAAITHPMRIVEDPTTTPEEVHAVEAVHPEFVAQVRAAFGDLLSQNTKGLKPHQRRHAATVMGMSQYAPAKLAKWQSLYQIPASKGGPKPSGSTPRTSKNPRSASMAPFSDSVKR